MVSFLLLFKINKFTSQISQNKLGRHKAPFVVMHQKLQILIFCTLRSFRIIDLEADEISNINAMISSRFDHLLMAEKR